MERKNKLRKIHLENFKGIKDLSIGFGDVTWISGKNASGKTTIADAFSWLLFDKDSSGSSVFSIRPKDADGKDIDNLEIKVEATLDVDGEELTLTKVQKQKWTKHRGSTAPTFEGNVNDFQVNGFPAKKSEYEQKIRDLIDENLFKLLTNPRTFASMKWQDQRKTLMEFVSEITDEDILNLDIEKYEPIRTDVLAAGADKARDKANASLRSLKKEQAEYPVRIDEAMRQVRNGLPDSASLMEQKNKLESELQTVQNSRKSLFKASNVVADIQDEIISKQRRMAEIERYAMSEDMKHNADAASKVNAALSEVRNLEHERDLQCSKRKYLESAISENRSAMESVKVRYKDSKVKEFPESESKCPTCGRPFEPERIAELKAAFNQRKEDETKALRKKGDDIWAKIQSDTKLLESLNATITSLTKDVETANAEWERLKEIASHPFKTDYKAMPEYKKLHDECEELKAKLASMEDSNSVDEEYEKQESEIRTKINVVNEQLTAIRVQAGWVQRVEDLKEQQRDCGQRVADQEQIVYLLDEFVMAKMNLLSDKINEKFQKVRFKLFDTQINGAVKETCVMQINSNGSYVDYNSANNAARIIGGLDVIEALSGLYGVTAPIFLDNAEAINDSNIPDMDAQLILLEVSEDDTLQIEKR